MSTTYSPLQDFVESSEHPLLPLLPLVHTTTAFSLRSMKKEDRIRKNEKEKNLGKPLVYFFYGRPAYRVADQVNFLLHFSWPVALIFHPSVFRKIEAVYPLDTGAFFRRLYSHFFHEDTSIEDLLAGREIASASKLVSAFFRSNSEYFNLHPPRNLPDLPPESFEIEGVQALMANRRISQNLDERASSVEVHVDREIDLSKECPLAVVVPQDMYSRDSELISACQRWGQAEIRYYETYNFTSYDSWHQNIYSVVRAVYEQHGFL